MTETEYLLACVAEECSEIQKAALKALRFGLNSRNPFVEHSPTNEAELLEEFHQLNAVIEMLYASKAITPLPVDKAHEIRYQKAKAVQWYMDQKNTKEE